LLPSSAWADSRATLAAGNESAPPAGKPDYDITIGTGLIEVAPGRIVSTTTYNGQFPGPLLRFREGQQTTVDIHNHRDVPEPLHWHGQFVPPDIEGDAAHHFLPDAGVDPVLKTRGEAAMKASLAKGMPHGYEVGYRLFTINGQPYDWQTKPVTRTLDRGKRYRRLRMHNVADDIHPIHLHRNSFEITRFAGQATAGVMKDVAMLGGYQRMDVDFVANRPGLTLFHCHQQLHMDYGFMVLFDMA
jgi:FtsP/CotA-like multicopper oxidase with cupredoxin domain